MGTRGEQSVSTFCSYFAPQYKRDENRPFLVQFSIQREFLSQDALLVQEKAIAVNQRRGDPAPIQLTDHKGLPIKLG